MGTCYSRKSSKRSKRYRESHPSFHPAAPPTEHPEFIVQDDEDTSLYEDVDPQPISGQSSEEAIENRREDRLRASKSDDSAFDDVSFSAQSGIDGIYSYTYTDIPPKKDSPSIPEMVEKYRDKLEVCVQAREIVNYIPFIDKSDILHKAIESPKIAMRMLIDQLHCSEEQGKWQTFIFALKEAGYKAISEAIEGSPTNDQEHEHLALIRIFAQTLCQALTPSEILPRLVAKGLINESDRQQIECEERNNGRIAASSKLLAFLPNKSQSWFVDFLLTLRECELGFLADAIEGPKTSIKGVVAENLPEDIDITSCNEKQGDTVANLGDSESKWSIYDSTYKIGFHKEETAETKYVIDNSETSVRNAPPQMSCQCACASLKATMSELLEVQRKQISAELHTFISKDLIDQISAIAEKYISTGYQRDPGFMHPEYNLLLAHKTKQRRHSVSGYCSSFQNESLFQGD